MSFMKQQLIKDRAYQVETTAGTEIVPFHVVGEFPGGNMELQDYCEGTIISPRPIRLSMGYVYRLSAPGYLDCTSWGYASTEAMAIIHLRELYGDEESGDANIEE